MKITWPRLSRSTWLCIGVGTWVVTLVLPYVLVSIPWIAVDVPRAGQIGDASGLANSVINSIALIYLIRTLELQGEELDSQRTSSQDERELAALSALVSGLASKYEFVFEKQRIESKVDRSVLNSDHRLSRELRKTYKGLSTGLARLEAMSELFFQKHPEVMKRLEAEHKKFDTYDLIVKQHKKTVKGLDAKIKAYDTLRLSRIAEMEQLMKEEEEEISSEVLATWEGTKDAMAGNVKMLETMRAQFIELHGSLLDLFDPHP